MLISFKFSLVGINLLLLSHITNAFVLLTANMDDVKNLARKFVSDSLADKISEFIAKATQNMMNAAEQKEKNSLVAPDSQDSREVSEENNKYNIQRYGLESAAQDASKSMEVKVKKHKAGSGSIELSKERKPVKQSHHNQKGVIINHFGGRSRYINGKKVEARPIERGTKNNGSDAKAKTKNKSIKKLNAIDGAAKTKKKSKHQSFRFLSQLTSVEDNEIGNFTANNSTIPEEESVQKGDLKTEKTTSKAKVKEFDQYDFKRAGLLATSGPMSLLIPRRSSNQKKWWEKQLPQTGKAQTER